MGCVSMLISVPDSYVVITRGRAINSVEQVKINNCKLRTHVGLSALWIRYINTSRVDFSVIGNVGFAIYTCLSRSPESEDRLYIRSLLSHKLYQPQGNRSTSRMN
ncbi:MAG: hypothetical protein HOP11_10910 [Saprospiraceae bacterium]|nr:hypothetical protein [Saprospiraceae bacterium]